MNNLLSFTLPVLSAVVGLSAMPMTAIAQEFDYTPVQVERGFLNLETGPLGNDSNVPIPYGIPETLSERQAIPVIEGVLAPSTIVGQADESRVLSAIRAQLPDGFDVIPESINFNSILGLSRIEGAHDFGEGSSVFVNGEFLDQVFIRGDVVVIGPNGESLENEAFVTASYRLSDVITVEVINLRENGAQPTQSGVWFAADGSLAAEDIRGGGDLDFFDGRFLQIIGGDGTAQVVALETSSFTVESIDFGQVEMAQPQSALLAHAIGAIAPTGEQLINSVYTSARASEVNDDGSLAFTVQSAPLTRNPSAWPTLVSAGVSVMPTARNNEAIATTEVSLTQYLGSTHTSAGKDADDNQLLTLARGLFDRPEGGYVKVRDRLVETDGIFNLPSDKDIEIYPLGELSGPGDSAYSSTGGIALERMDGSRVFVPQWTEAEKETQPFRAQAGTYRRAYYALVPEQAGVVMPLGEIVPVDGSYRIITALEYPENFAALENYIYAVEDTLADGPNQVTDEFNGIPGIYEGIPTNDLITDSADGYLGNSVYSTQLLQVEPNAGNAIAPYLRATFSGGFGNQRDTVSTTQVTVTDSFSAPLSFDITEDEEIVNVRVLDIVHTSATDSVSETESRSGINASALTGDLSLGLVANLSNTVWTPAANTIRAELFASDSVLGRGDAEYGARLEIIYNLFGERTRPAHTYLEGQVVPVVDESGHQIEVGTGRSRGPALIGRVASVFGGETDVTGGLRMTF